MRIEVVTACGYWEVVSDEIGQDLYLYDDDAYEDLDPLIEEDIIKDGGLVLRLKEKERY